MADRWITGRMLMAENGSRATARIPAGQPELAAELEVTKIIAFYALMAGLRALEGDTRARIENFERAIKSFFLTYETNLAHEEHVRFQRQAQITIEDLLRRIDIDQHPYRQRAGEGRA
jgi:hypothetical protein